MTLTFFFTALGDVGRSELLELLGALAKDTGVKAGSTSLELPVGGRALLTGTVGELEITDCVGEFVGFTLFIPLNPECVVVCGVAGEAGVAVVAFLAGTKEDVGELVALTPRGEIFFSG
jgi:hypothetical protein